MRALLLAAVLATSPAIGQEEANDDNFDPSTLTLEDVLACKIDVRTYVGFAFWFHDNKAAHKHYGLTPIHGGENPFLSEYRLVRPVTVFGKQTTHVAFTNSGLLAVLSGVTAQEMADQLEVRDGGDFMGKYLAEKVISEERIDDEALDLHGSRTVKLNVSTVTSHPDRVLVGCSYRINIDDE